MPFSGYTVESGRLSADAAKAPATSRMATVAAATSRRRTGLPRDRMVADCSTAASTRFQPRILAPGEGATGSTARSRSASRSSRCTSDAIDRPPLQDALQRTQRAVLQGLNRTDGLAQNDGDLGGRQVLEEPQDQHLLLLIREVAQRGAQVVVRELLDRQLGGIR